MRVQDKYGLGRLIIAGMICLLSIANAFSQDWERAVDLRGFWKFSIGDDKKWLSPGYDDSRWENIFVPSPWEEEGFIGYDGYAWYRKTIDGSELPENKNVYLFLGYIDDVDEVYFNEQLIGTSGSFPPRYNTAWTAYRRYLIPREFINENGENLIAVRVFDEGQVGGIYSGKIGIYYDRDEVNYAINLEGLWKFRKGDNENWRRPNYDDRNWDNIMAPSPWEKTGYHHYDGYGWYRKTFILPKDWDEDEPMLLLLGRIDDFDWAYLNGEQIGYTYDGRRYGQSRSFLEERAYPIPFGLLKKDGPNTIAIRVEDMGNVGGIYEGPVGIIRERDYRKKKDNDWWWKQ